MLTRARFTVLILALLGFSLDARDADPVLGDAFDIAAADESDAPAPAKAAVKPKAVQPKKSKPAAPDDEEISDGIDLEADLKAIEHQHAQVQAASARTEAAMDQETHKAKQIQVAKQNLMIPDAEMAMITKNVSMGLVLLKHRDSSINDLHETIDSLRSQVDKIQKSNSVLSDKFLKVSDDEKQSWKQAKEISQLKTEEQNLQDQLGELLAQSKVVERDSVTAAIREGDSKEDTSQKEALLKEENLKLISQNKVLKRQIAAQLRALKTKRLQLDKSSSVTQNQASARAHMIQELRANQTRLRKEVVALGHEDARWRRKVANLKPLEAKDQQEKSREMKLVKASAGLEKNLRKARLSLAGLTQSKLEATAARLDKEEALLKKDQLNTEKKILRHQAQMRELDRETGKMQKQLQLARTGRLRRVVDNERVKRMAKANQKLRTSVKLLAQKLKKVTEQNAKLGATIAAANSDANDAEAASS